MYRSKKTALLLIAALVIVSLLASGCSAWSGTPTPSLQELQMTAQAAAAQTLTAQPTQPPSPTPIPPTPTPEPVIVLPEEEIFPLDAPAEVVPTQPVVVVPPSSADEENKEQDCTGAIGAGTEGPREAVRVVNKKGAAITLSYYLEPNLYGQCGSGSVSLEGGSETLNLPVGCYWLYAWVTYDGRDESFQGYGCNPKSSGAVWNIYPDRIEAVENTR